ncbi:MAG: hypothetical protein ACI4SM_04785 [Candidatus Gastranaerophilaceae bacterium]
MEDEKNQNNVDTQTTTDNAQNKEQKTENKNEGEKTKKQVAQKGEDGSIVFKNQDELDGFIRRMYAKGAEKAEQGETSKQVQKTQNKQEEQGQEQMEQQTVPADYLLTKVALAMAKAGVNAEKVERASRLVDISKIQENGAINDKSLEDEINAVIAEFPELKNAKEEEKQEKGFKFGATEGTSNSNQTQKRPVATKRWNRFNSF